MASSMIWTRLSARSAAAAARPPALVPPAPRQQHYVVPARQRSHALAAAGGPEPLPHAAAPVTDAAVPEGHQSLHNFLYDGGDAEHSARSYEFREGEDDGSSILAVGPYLESREGEKPLGVYALYDERHALQFISYSRNIVLSVKGHLARVGEARCAFIRPMVFANKAMATRSHMQAQAADWLAEAGVVPPGNGVEAALWGGSVSESDEGGAAASGGGVSHMSAAEAAAYEDKKLKMRKAMGESLLDDEDTDAAAADRRLALLAAVSGDNWSSVVSEQTQATLEAAVAAGGGRRGGRQLGAAAEAAREPARAVAAAAAGGGGAGSSGPDAAAAAASGAVVSPFSKASVHRQVGEKHGKSGGGGDEATPALTPESVDAALAEVRPYLLADGGDVAVVGVEDGVVAVALQGACSSCASSSATLKMGIERQLKAVFGDAVKEVVQVESGGRPRASVEAIELHLNMLRSAVANLGGAVEVKSVGGGVACLRFRGPPAIGKGLSAAIRDAFPDVKEVVLVEFD